MVLACAICLSAPMAAWADTPSLAGETASEDSSKPVAAQPNADQPNTTLDGSVKTSELLMSDTKNSGAARFTPALSVTFTCTLPRVVGNVVVEAVTVPLARALPYAAAIDDGAIE